MHAEVCPKSSVIQLLRRRTGSAADVADHVLGKGREAMSYWGDAAPM